MFRDLVALALLGCSASGENGAPSGSDSGGTGGSEAGAAGDGGMGPTAGTGGTSEAGTAGTGGEPDLCQAGDERLCSCAPGYGGKQTCSEFGWNLCVCPDWPPAGGSGGSGGSGTAWPTCPRDPLDNSTARHPNGCPATWPNVSEVPDCTDPNAEPNQALCTFDCRSPLPCPEGQNCPAVPPLVFDQSRATWCESLGGSCSETEPQCLP